MIKTDIRLKQDIEDELRWDPKVNSAQIGVTVDKGAVALLGEVDTYAAKWATEDAVKRVYGVRAVAQDLKVKLSGEHARTDSDIAAAALSALKWDVFVPDSVTVTVQDGRVTLGGEVRWNFEREAAGRAVRYLMGVVGMVNNVTLKPEVSTSQVKANVTAALQRQATADAKSIHVDASGGKVTLTGHASSWQGIEDASEAAWGAQGVTQVVDKIQMSVS